MTLALHIENVHKRYGETVALQSTSLDVRAGEFLTLLGPSGSGKTTLLSLIAGLVVPDGGRIVLGGRDILALAPHQRGLGMVFQNYALFPHMSVADNVAFGLRARRMPASEVHDKVLRALSMVRLEALSQRLPRELSGGQQQRVALARALAYAPGLVLMDEPLGALDRNLREEMKEEIVRLHRELGTTVIYVTHDQEEALVMSDRICLMNQARVEQVASPHALYFTPETRFAAEFLGESNLLVCEMRNDGRCVSPTLGMVFAQAASATAPAASRLVLIRPESIDLVRTDASDVTAQQGVVFLRGIVQQHTFLGAMTRMVVALPGAALKVLQRTASLGLLQQHPVGSEVTLSIDFSRCHILAA